MRSPINRGSAAVRKRCFNMFDFLNIAAVVSSGFTSADFPIFQLTLILKADGELSTFTADIRLHDGLHPPQEMPKRELFVARGPHLLLRLCVDDKVIFYQESMWSDLTQMLTFRSRQVWGGG